MKLSKKFFVVTTAVLLLYSFFVSAAYTGRVEKHNDTLQELEIEKALNDCCTQYSK